MSRAQSCPACSAPMVHETRDDVVSYKGHTRAIPTLGWWCTQCGEAILTGEPLAANERAFKAFEAEIDAKKGKVP